MLRTYRKEPFPDLFSQINNEENFEIVKIFESTIFTVPPLTTLLYVTLWGAGSPGSSAHCTLINSPGYGGSSGAVFVNKPVVVSPGQRINVIIGVGGQVNDVNANCCTGFDGGDSIFENLIARGGKIFGNRMIPCCSDDATLCYHCQDTRSVVCANLGGDNHCCNKISFPVGLYFFTGNNSGVMICPSENELTSYGVTAQAGSRGYYGNGGKVRTAGTAYDSKLHDGEKNSGAGGTGGTYDCATTTYQQPGNGADGGCIIKYKKRI